MTELNKYHLPKDHRNFYYYGEYDPETVYRTRAVETEKLEIAVVLCANKYYYLDEDVGSEGKLGSELGHPEKSESWKSTSKEDADFSHIETTLFYRSFPYIRRDLTMGE